MPHHRTRSRPTARSIRTLGALTFSAAAAFSPNLFFAAPDRALAAPQAAPQSAAERELSPGGSLWRTAREFIRDGDLLAAEAALSDAADAGHPEAQALVGAALLTGRPVLLEAPARPPSDAELMRAARLLSAAAEAGVASAAYNLALMNEYGVGMPADPEAARSWHRKAAAAGHALAATRLAAMTVAREIETVQKAARDAAESAAQATAPTATDAASARPSETVADAADPAPAAPPQAGRDPRQASINGDAADDRALIEGDFATGGVRPVDDDADRAAVLADLPPDAAADAPSSVPSPPEQAALSPAIAPLPPIDPALDLYRAGALSAAASAWRTRAADGDAEAMFWLGRLHNRGEGAELDRARAFIWWRRAAALGHDGAVTALVNLGPRLSDADIARAEALLGGGADAELR